MIEIINDRLKDIRASKNMNQVDFANLLGIGQSTLGMMEVGKRKISERHIKTICSICHVSEKWLRTGEGEMYTPDAPADFFDSMRNELKLSDVEEKILRNYFDLDIKSRKAVVDFIYKIGSSFDKSSTSEEEKWQAKRKALHDQLDAELDAEEKEQSASDSGNIGTGKRA